MRLGSPAALAVLALIGCAGPVRKPAAPPATESSASTTLPQGKPYTVLAQQSLLTIRVYRGGTLARMGHNHVIASHDLTGAVYVPEDLTRASFELHIPVDKLTVDEASLRTEAGPDFPPEVPDSAKEGTRRNMLGAGVLDAEHYPEIVLKSARVDVAAPADLLTQIQVTVRDQTHLVATPVHYEVVPNGELIATGELALKQSELGLTPFSVMMGALQVLDDMKIRFRIYCAPMAH
jgi:polyisoprenoid-binding protein YceI